MDLLRNSDTRRKWSLLDWVLLFLFLFFAVLVGYRLFFVLKYKWNWQIIPTYLVRFDPNTGRYTTNVLLDGLLTTLRLSIWGMLIASVCGSVMGLLRLSRRRICRLASIAYVQSIRNLPPLVLIFLFYYFVSDQILPVLGIEEYFRSRTAETQTTLAHFFARPELISQFFSGVFTLGLFQGAYITEIVRSGIQAVDTGQWEAAAALGLNRWQQLVTIILPQATRIMLPALANEFINTIKYSSIVSIISIQELTFQGLQVMASTQASIEVWLTITGMYLLICLSLSLLVSWLERRYARHGR